MRVLIAGSRNWVDYNEIMRKMTVVLDEWVSSNPSNTKITFIHTGLSPAENMTTEYIGKVEKLVKQKGYSITEELVKPDGYSFSPKEIMSLGVNRAVIFIRDSCKKSQGIGNITSTLGIKTDIVKG